MVLYQQALYQQPLYQQAFYQWARSTYVFCEEFFDGLKTLKKTPSNFPSFGLPVKF
ncbi:MAG: hypothetical protein H7Z11_19835 [Verrucomicrobia bacterium]|nr:hypothetical protein [Leptolyngbya sp. ES-bin-22]